MVNFMLYIFTIKKPLWGISKIPTKIHPGTSIMKELKWNKDQILANPSIFLYHLIEQDMLQLCFEPPSKGIFFKILFIYF